MSSCDHSPVHIEMITESAFTAKCKCTNCGKTFDVKGWANRGTFESFLDGLTGGLRILIGSEIKDDIKKIKY
jgi:uncharacterized Zn-finger protein